MALLCVSLAVVVSLMPERPGARLVPFSLVAAALWPWWLPRCIPGPGCSRPSCSCCSRWCGSRRSCATPGWASPSSGTRRSPDSLRRVCRAGESSPVISADLDVRLREWRHHLHRHPETGFGEHRTGEYVADVLDGLGLEVTRGVGGTGLVASLRRGDGSGRSGLRADMDACHCTSVAARKPYRPDDRRRHARLRPRRAHGDAAGRRGESWRGGRFRRHGAARLPAGRGARPGREGDARRRAAGPVPDGRDVRAAQHAGDPGRSPAHPARRRSWPARTTSRSGSPVAAGTPPGRRWSSTRSSSPRRSCWRCRRSSPATSTRATRPSCPAPRSSPTAPATRSPARSSSVATPAASPPPSRRCIEDRMRACAQGICAAHGATCTVGYTHEFEPTVNDPGCTAAAVRAATAAVGADGSTRTARRSWRSEDFGVFARAVPGCFAFLGNGTEPGHGGTRCTAATTTSTTTSSTAGVRFYVELVRSVLPREAPCVTPPTAPWFAHRRDRRTGRARRRRRTRADFHRACRSTRRRRWSTCRRWPPSWAWRGSSSRTSRPGSGCPRSRRSVRPGPSTAPSDDGTATRRRAADGRRRDRRQPWPRRREVRLRARPRRAASSCRTACIPLRYRRSGRGRGADRGRRLVRRRGGGRGPRRRGRRTRCSSRTPRGTATRTSRGWIVEGYATLFAETDEQLVAEAWRGPTWSSCRSASGPCSRRRCRTTAAPDASGHGRGRRRRSRGRRLPGAEPARRPAGHRRHRRHRHGRAELRHAVRASHGRTSSTASTRSPRSPTRTTSGRPRPRRSRRPRRTLRRGSLAAARFALTGEGSDGRRAHLGVGADSSVGPGHRGGCRQPRGPVTVVAVRTVRSPPGACA